jgi:hypothetical protein
MTSLHGMLHRTNAGLLAHLIDVLYPFCSAPQQRGFVRQLEPEGTSFVGSGKRQYVNHLAELLEYPSASDDEVSLSKVLSNRHNR